MKSSMKYFKKSLFSVINQLKGFYKTPSHINLIESTHKKMEEDKKAELNSKIWKKHQEKEAKGLKKIFIFIFLVVVLTYIVKEI